MQRRYSLAHFVLAGVIVLVLTPLVIVVDVQAQIAFHSKRDGNFEIYVMAADGGNQRRLTNNTANDLSPSWSPNGKRIAFVSNRDGHVHVKHGWSTSDIYVMDADGSNQQNLTNNPHNDRQPSWSPNGERIVFSANRDWDNPQSIDIYVMDADGRNEQRLTENRKNDRHPSWSPDGNRIAFSADRKGDLQNFDIYVMDADGGNEQKLTENRVHDRSPSWSPNGNRIVFASEKDGNWESLDIYVMDTDGGNLQNLTNNPRIDLNPAWLNSPFSVSPAGKKFTVWGSLKQRER